MVIGPAKLARCSPRADRLHRALTRHSPLSATPPPARIRNPHNPARAARGFLHGKDLRTPDGAPKSFVRDTVREGLDLSAIFGTYEVDRGQPPYHPGMMVALLLYGYACGVYSSRRLGAGLRVAGGLHGGERPAHPYTAAVSSQ